MSTVGHPVALGGYLAMALPVSLAETLAAGLRRQRVVLGVGTVLLVGALLLTFSRGVLLVLWGWRAPSAPADRGPPVHLGTR